jgi:hypothetical protein
MTRKPSICVYCGSRTGDNPIFKAAIEALGRGIAERGMTVVYGGGRAGNMGFLADAAVAAGGRVIGVIPHHLDQREVGHRGIDQLFVVNTMHERKAKMAELSDAFVIMPGGLGTLDETFEILTWKQLDLHNRPVIVADIGGYWRELFDLMARIVDEGFMTPAHLKLFERLDSVEAVLKRIETLTPYARTYQLHKA